MSKQAKSFIQITADIVAELDEEDSGFLVKQFGRRPIPPAAGVVPPGDGRNQPPAAGGVRPARGHEVRPQ